MIEVPFNHVDKNGVVIIRRKDSKEYVLKMVLDQAIKKGERIVIQYEDGSSTVINPTETL